MIVKILFLFIYLLFGYLINRKFLDKKKYYNKLTKTIILVLDLFFWPLIILYALITPKKDL